MNTEFRIDCEGVFTKYAAEGYAPECWIWNSVKGEHYTHPEENVTDAIKDSCNYYFYTVGHDLGVKKMGEYAPCFWPGGQHGDRAGRDGRQHVQRGKPCGLRRDGVAHRRHAAGGHRQADSIFSPCSWPNTAPRWQTAAPAIPLPSLRLCAALISARRSMSGKARC